MPPAVTPELALRYLRELSADLVAAAVLTADGRTLAGSEPLAKGAMDLLARFADDGATYAVLEGRTGDGVVVVARCAEHAVVAVHTALALPGLVRHDVVTVLGDLAAEPGAAPGELEPRVIPPADVALAAVLRASATADSAL